MSRSTTATTTVTTATAVLASLLLALGTPLGAPSAAAQTETEFLADDVHLVTPQTRRAIDAGLAYLAGTRNKDGSFGKKAEYRIAVTSLAGLAFLAGGHVPGRGKYGNEIEAALNYILERAELSRSTGYITDQGDKSRMHGHGYATLFLAEVYGMTRDEASREKISKAIVHAIRDIEAAQERKGGWGYVPHDRRHEGSITVCCLQALRAARDVGFRVSKPVLIKAVQYMIASANEDGSFKYRLGGGRSHATFPLTAAAISTMNAFGVYDTTTSRLLGEDFPQMPGIMRRGMAFMDRYVNGNATDRYYDNFFYYAEFYAAQAYYKSSFDGRGRQWTKYYARTRDLLLDSDRFNGGRWGRSRYGSAYATAISTMILQIPYKYLPIFQR